MRYYCEDCNRFVPTTQLSEQEPYEFWGEKGWTLQYFLICGLCDSSALEEVWEGEYEKFKVQ